MAPSREETRRPRASLTTGNYVIALLGVGLLIGSISGLVLFDDILNDFVDGQVVLQTNDDGQFSWSGQNWAKPLYEEYMMFYMFEWTNPIETMFHGAKPAVQERGPYSYRQTDHKHNVSFGGNGTYAWYLNYRTWYLALDHSCDTCQFNDTMMLSNLVYMGTATTPSLTGTAIGKKIWNLLSGLLGMKPYVKVQVNELLFSGYHDPLIGLLNLFLPLIPPKLASKVIPPALYGLTEFAFFYGYNASTDGWYRVHTGKGDVSRVGQVMEWRGHERLPETWWKEPNSKAQELRGTDAGQVQGPHLKDTDHPEVFISYWCRSFHLDPVGPTIVRDSLDTYRYKIPDNVFNTSANYNKPFSMKGSDPDYPEGLMPIPCQPGKRIAVGFEVVYSSPHFLYAPEVQNSVIGLHPDPEKHQLGYWDYIQLLGYPMRLTFRQQINVPQKNQSGVTMLRNVHNVYQPLLWLNEAVLIDEHTATFVSTYVQGVSRFATGFIYAGIVLGVVIAVLALSTPYLRNRFSGYQRAKRVADVDQSNPTQAEHRHESQSGDSHRRRTSSRRSVISHDDINEAAVDTPTTSESEKSSTASRESLRKPPVTLATSSAAEEDPSQLIAVVERRGTQPSAPPLAQRENLQQATVEEVATVHRSAENVDTVEEPLVAAPEPPKVELASVQRSAAPIDAEETITEERKSTPPAPMVNRNAPPIYPLIAEEAASVAAARFGSYDERSSVESGLSERDNNIDSVGTSGATMVLGTSSSAASTATDGTLLAPDNVSDSHQVQGLRYQSTLM